MRPSGRSRRWGTWGDTEFIACVVHCEGESSLARENSVDVVSLEFWNGCTCEAWTRQRRPAQALVAREDRFPHGYHCGLQTLNFAAISVLDPEVVGPGRGTIVYSALRSKRVSASRSLRPGRWSLGAPKNYTSSSVWSRQLKVALHADHRNPGSSRW